MTAALQLAPDEPDRLRRAPLFGDWIDECRRLLRPGSPVGFKSSGSCGHPRLIVHDWPALTQEIDALAEIFCGARRIAALVPAHHIYGFLFTILLPLRLGVPVFDARAHAAASLSAFARAGDLIVGFPTIFELASQSAARWPQGVAAVSSGAPCKSAVAKDLTRNGLAQFVEIYGSTETGGVGWREGTAEAFRLLPYWSKLGDDAIEKLGGGERRAFDLPDIVRWSGDAALSPVGRRDGAVQIGAVNVYPALTRSCLLAHPGVAEAQVRPMREEEGDRLKAFIVPKDQKADVARLRASLEAWVDARLTPAERPRAFTFGAAPPHAPSGKPADWPIDERSSS